jgi:hypothetical protein
MMAIDRGRRRHHRRRNRWRRAGSARVAGTAPETRRRGEHGGEKRRNRDARAAYRNHPKVVQFLADHGAKIELWNEPDKHHWTPLAIAEGHRFGNFKPDAETASAIRKVMLAAGVTPPPDSSASADAKSGY